MARITVHLPLETERTLQDKAARHGQTLESYIRQVLEADAQSANGAPVSAIRPTSPESRRADFERRLDALAAGLPALPVLPADLSRAALHGEHD